MNPPIANPETALAQPNGEAPLPRELSLAFVVRDAEIIAELAKHPDGPPREEYALSALRLGVLALRQASGVIDSTAIREEGQRLIGSVREALMANSKDLLGGLQGVVQQYFDPRAGVFQQRLEQLLKKDGELESVLARHVGGDTSTIALTLAKHIGEQSPIFRLLSPKQTDGLLAALTKTLEDALCSQRDHIIEQFSLDKEESALSRLIRDLTDANGKLKEELAKDVEKVAQEFSLDNEDGALSRLVSRVERAQATISGEFSLDNKESALSRLSGLLAVTNQTVSASLTLDDEKSPLSRLRSELLKVIEDLTKTNTDFHTEIRETLAALQARKQEAARSTRHGGEFELAVGEMLQAEAQRLGDVVEAVGTMVGVKPRCKVGDHTVTLGKESAAPGAMIVCESKEMEGVTLQAALKEIEEARENRRAQVGIFVFSKLTAPAGIEPIQRHGKDVVVVWDRDDVQTDVYLKAAVSIARALVVREHAASERQQAEFVELEQAIAKIAKDAERVQQIGTYAQTARNAVGKIADEVEVVRDDLQKQIELLRSYAASQRRGADSVAA
jgi:type II secretory pathway component PulJ